MIVRLPSFFLEYPKEDFVVVELTLVLSVFDNEEGSPPELFEERLLVCLEMILVGNMLGGIVLHGKAERLRVL